MPADLANFEQFEAERLELLEEAERRRPILKQAGENGVAALREQPPSRERKRPG
jgi:hypothetical protein